MPLSNKKRKNGKVYQRKDTEHTRKSADNGLMFIFKFLSRAHITGDFDA